MPQPRSRTSSADGHIVITGTGRAGTTFLVQLFTALGFDTGHSLEEALNKVNAISRAGLERHSVDGPNPYVIKSPWFADQLSEALENRRVKLRAALIPLRDLFHAAESRRRVYFEASARGFDPLKFPGTLWHTDKPDEQEEKLALQFYKCVFPLIKHEVPIFFLEFPRIVHDKIYLFKKLAPLFDDHGVELPDFLSAYEKSAKPGLVHEF
ncbi:MAG: sulfotransferase [Beijerinckiaceae bacterium]|nr:sulfotransferase [Beijerinckiaceae bacterium]MCI0735675.1 sulfotransferase [Beijerinckiaceae bacterium]